MVTTSGGFLDTNRICLALGLAEGMHVGDFGSGSGYFSVCAGAQVGKDGKVYAVDVQEGPLESVAAMAQARGLENVVPVRADLEVLGGTNIPGDSLDMVLLANVLFQSQKKDAIVREAHRTLKPGGRLLVIDWKKGGGGGVPDELRTDEQAMKRIVEEQGFRFEADVPAGQFYFGMMFKK